jgi:hypothetical protein
MMNGQVIDIFWINEIGIVRIRPEYGEDKFYIGISNGNDIKEDVDYIRNYGYPIYPEVLQSFFKRKI